MLEAAIALIVLFLAANFGAPFVPHVQHYTDHAPERKGSVAGTLIFGAIALYCIVRFIHWAWLTPIPFIGK